MDLAASFAAALVVTVWPQGAAGPSHTHRVACPGAAVCAQLAQAGSDAFAPVGPGQMCSQIYGGPQRALVTGTLGGRHVRARFQRTDGCQTARWQRVSFLLGT